MRHLFLAVILACASMQASALVIEPQKEPAPSTKPVKQKAVSTPTKARFAPPSKATLGFYHASASDNYDMMELYLQQGADINCRNCDQEGNTPLHKVLTRIMGGLDSMNNSTIWLIDHGADINLENKNGETPLMRSIPLSFDGIYKNQWVGAKLGISQLMKLLLDKGAKATVKDIQGNTPLTYITMVGSRNDSDRSQAERSAFASILVALLEHGANINATNNLGNTVLMDAAEHCADFSVETLLTYKADPTIKNKLGQTALGIAIEKATRSGQNSNCNNTVKILQNPAQISSAYPVQQGNSSSTAPNSAPQNSAFGAYAGNYSGNYGGDDNGPFQVTVEQDGNIKLTGKSLRNNQAFTGNGKMNRDGSLGISLGNISTGATFQGSINPKTGALYGTWKNGEQAGNFSGNKQTAQTQASNPIEAISGLFNVLNKVLAK